jgi:SagB-type dehydrogenase family enzyme
VSYWQSGELYIENYLTASCARTSPLVMGVLDAASEYVTQAQLTRAFHDVPDIPSLVKRLLQVDFLLERGSSKDKADRTLDKAWAWGPAARFFHNRTQSVPYEEDLDQQRASIVALARGHRPPSPYKEYRSRPMKLPAVDEEGEFWSVLRERRSRRKFGSAPLPLLDFARILGWTWGSIAEIEHKDLGAYLLKTSPSGGARHPIEVYPVVLNVEGVDPGIYHYSVRKHALSLLRTGDFRALCTDLLARQPWAREAAAVFLMTAVVERSMWKYRHDHAYRVLLLDAGHLGQTLHLVCTKLGVSVVTSSAKDDRLIEKVLRIDGISEISLYAAAVGIQH